MNIKDRLQHGWNAFLGRDPTLIAILLKWR